MIKHFRFILLTFLAAPHVHLQLINNVYLVILDHNLQIINKEVMFFNAFQLKEIVRIIIFKANHLISLSMVVIK
jgi:hypothetical protein